MKKIDKRIVWVGLGVIIFLLIACAALFWTKNSSRLSTATPTTISVVVTSTPTTALPGNIWVVSKIEEAAIHQNGYVYDVATFTNLDRPSVTLRAQCAAPGWPAPAIGQQYVMNDYRVLVPIEGIDSPLQRFFVLP